MIKRYAINLGIVVVVFLFFFNGSIIECANIQKTATQSVSIENTNNKTNQTQQAPVIAEKDYVILELEKHWDFLQLCMGVLGVLIAVFGIIISVCLYFFQKSSSSRISEWAVKAENEIVKIEKLRDRAENEIEKLIKDARERIEGVTDKLIKDARERIEGEDPLARLKLIEEANKQIQKKFEELAGTTGTIEKQVDFQDVNIENESKKIESTSESNWTSQDYFIMALKTTDLDKRIDYCTNAIGLKEDFYVARNLRGVAYFLKGNFDDAIRDFSKLIEMLPESWNAYVNRANAFMNLGRHSDAIPDYSKAIDLEPAFDKSHAGRGAAYFALAESATIVEEASINYERAEKDYLEAIRLNPKHQKALYDLGCLYNMQNNKHKDEKKALEYLQRSADCGYSRIEIVNIHLESRLKSLKDSPKFKEIYNNIVQNRQNKA